MDINDNFNLDKNKRNVVYVDANNLFFRSYYAAQSNNQNPLHIFLNSAYNLKTQINHDFMFAIFDGENSKDKRLEIYPEYKANREEKTKEEKEEINQLMIGVNKILDALGYTKYSSENGIECDDVIGILSKKSIQKGLNVIVVTSDKDYLQLCEFSPYINIYNQQKKTICNQNNFFEMNNMPCDKFVDYLVLTGDGVDGIKGVDKIGKVTALKIINEYGGLEKIKKIYEENKKNNHEDLIPEMKNGVVKTNLINAIENGEIELYTKLIKFMFHEENAIENIPKHNLKNVPINIQKLDEFCIKYNMNQFREQMIEPMIKSGYYSRSQELYDMLEFKNKERKNRTYRP